MYWEMIDVTRIVFPEAEYVEDLMQILYTKFYKKEVLLRQGTIANSSRVRCMKLIRLPQADLDAI